MRWSLFSREDGREEFGEVRGLFVGPVELEEIQANQSKEESGCFTISHKLTARKEKY